jgi:hypothetical protein
MIVSPFGFCTFVDQSASYSFEEVISLHETLTYRVVGDEAIFGNFLLGLLYRPESNMSRYWALLFYSLPDFGIKRGFVLFEFLEDLLDALAVEDITDIIFMLYNSIYWRFIVPKQNFLYCFFGFA